MALSFIFINSFTFFFFFFLQKKNSVRSRHCFAPLRPREIRYMKYVSFPWPPVVVPHDHKRLAQALHTGSNRDYYQQKLLAVIKTIRLPRIK